jgi:hypothetical protein
MTLDALRRRAAVSADELSHALPDEFGSPRSVLRMMDRGELPELRLGRRRLVPVPALLRLLGAEHDDAPAGTTAGASGDSAVGREAGGRA